MSLSFSSTHIITVVSDVGLPELERFRVETLAEQPTLRVNLGKVRPIKKSTTATDPNLRYIYYEEGLGSFGFGINVTLGETIDIMASPILRRSPHVLYTNVVEPILRWTFVEKGYALAIEALVRTIGGTPPEDLPTPAASIAELRMQEAARLKGVQLQILKGAGRSGCVKGTGRMER